jgi:cytochrome oxidase assembly protein ShyY1
MLGDDPWVKGESRVVIQSLDPEIISKKLSTKFYDFSLRLNASEIGALKTGWPVVNVQPGKHTGYAFQWSALALALIVLAIFANSNLGQVIGSRRS